MNDHRNHRYRESEPAWPTGDDSDPRASAKPREEAPERTGFWSPLWEDDDDDEPVARPARGNHARENGHALGAHAARSNGHAANGHSNGHARNGGEHRWPDAEPKAEPRWPSQPEPPARPRPAARSAAPAWPTADPGNPAGGRPPARPGGPHTPPPGVGSPNGAPVPNGARPPAGPTTRVVRPRPAGPPRPGVDQDGPTELLPPVHRGAGTGPEPQLLTHREPDYDEDLNDDPDLRDDYYDEDEDGPLSEDSRKRRRKKIWRRVRRTMYVFIALMIILPITGFFVAYQMVEVPTPEMIAADQDQVVTLMYNDGETQFSQIVPPEGTRKMVTYDELPDIVKKAVYAAEDADFETNPGFDITGVMRAGWNQVTGGDGGGSTITQQYIKVATGQDDQTLSRKGLEIVKAYKMNNTYSKEQILTAYLNTIYFGRSANGIAAAAKAYYGKSLDQLNASEAALLAGMIQNPGRYREQPYMERRWKFVMDQMNQKGWVSDADRKAAVFPPLTDVNAARPKAVSGPDAHIQAAVLDEVEREAGYTREDLAREGYTIKTTIDKTAQDMTIAALNEVMKDQPTNLLPAMVAIDPKTGEVRSYYGGANGNGLDWAAQRQEPGSSFKPFDLVALLQEGKGLGERYDGRSDLVIGGQKVRNSNGASCGEECTVAEAMERSINTVFYDIAVNEVGTQNVAKAAEQAGVKSPLTGENGAAPDANISIGGGMTRVSTYEMASAYATFAANGTYRTPHMVSQIVDAKGAIVWQPKDPTVGTPAFDKDPVMSKKIARNVTESLKPVLPYSKLTCANKRECAGKTGTHQFGETEDNAKAWMVGYTPQISVAVSMAAEENNKQVPLKNAKGKIIYGSGLPGEIWKTFMDNYLKDKPKEGFGKYEPIGKAPPKDGEDGNGKPTSNKPSGNKPSDNKPTTTTGQPTTTDSKPTKPTEPTDTTDPGGGGIIPPIGGGGGGNGDG